MASPSCSDIKTEIDELLDDVLSYDEDEFYGDMEKYKFAEALSLATDSLEGHYDKELLLTIRNKLQEGRDAIEDSSIDRVKVGGTEA